MIEMRRLKNVVIFIQKDMINKNCDVLVYLLWFSFQLMKIKILQCISFFTHLRVFLKLLHVEKKTFLLKLITNIKSR